MLFRDFSLKEQNLRLLKSENIINWEKDISNVGGMILIILKLYFKEVLILLILPYLMNALKFLVLIIIQ